MHYKGVVFDYVLFCLRRIIFCSSLYALGIGAVSFWSAAEKDIAESPPFKVYSL